MYTVSVKLRNMNFIVIYQYIDIMIMQILCNIYWHAQEWLYIVVFSFAAHRPWKKSLPGSCRNRKCFLRWAESPSALTPRHRVAFPSSTQSPASSPLDSRPTRRCPHSRWTDAAGPVPSSPTWATGRGWTKFFLSEHHSFPAAIYIAFYFPICQLGVIQA